MKINTICSTCKSVLVVRNKELALNTTIDFLLFVEGAINEIKRAIQDERKRLGYDVQQKIILCSEAAKIINFDSFRKEVQADAIFQELHNGCESIIVVQPYEIEIGIAKYPNLNS